MSSARRPVRTPSEANAAAAEWLSANISMLAAEVSERHFQRHPELDSLYGKRGRQHCRQDSSYHLHFLAEAIALDSPAIFLQYVAWAKIMLAARAIDTRELEQNLVTMQEVLAEQAPVHRDVIGSVVTAALQALPGMPSAVPQFLDEHHAVANQFLSALLRLDRSGAANVLKKELARGGRSALLDGGLPVSCGRGPLPGAEDVC